MALAPPSHRLCSVFDITEIMTSLSTTTSTTQLLPMLTEEGINPWLRVLRKMGHGVVVCDTEGAVHWLNQPLRKVLNLPPDDREPTPTGLSLLTLYEDPTGEKQEFLKKALNSCTQEGKTVQQELKVRARHDGPRQYFDVYMVPLYEGIGIADEDEAELSVDGLKQPVGAVVVFRNITAIKTTERMRRDFVANVSHELRTPLSVLKGYAESLLSGALEEPDLAREFVEIMDRHATRLSSLVGDLLDLSRLESPDFEMTLQPMWVKPLLERVVHMLNERAQAKQIQLVLAVSDNLPQIWGSPASLEQVLFNLVDNAIKYTPETGKVLIQVDVQDDGQVLFQVKDNGIGIEPKHFPRLFERFYRVDKARSRDMGGTGLGLSIVKHIVQAHKGSIWVNSQPGEGSTFLFTLQPVSEPQAREPETATLHT